MKHYHYGHPGVLRGQRAGSIFLWSSAFSQSLSPWSVITTANLDEDDLTVTQHLIVPSVSFPRYCHVNSYDGMSCDSYDNSLQLCFWSRTGIFVILIANFHLSVSWRLLLVWVTALLRVWQLNGRDILHAKAVIEGYFSSIELNIPWNKAYVSLYILVLYEDLW